MKIDQVLNENLRGDADKRMNLCLYREFRDEFGVIERDNPISHEISRQKSLQHGLLSSTLHVLQNTDKNFFSSYIHTDR